MEHLIGDPEYQTEYWEYQNMDDNCAVAAQTSILNQYLDEPISLEEANYFAYANGWYAPGYGTSMGDMANLLDVHGVPTHSVENASIEQLVDELQQGHRVIVGVNSDELWDQGPLVEFWNWFIEVFGLDSSEFTPANHAVVVTGVDLSDPDNPQVIINDSGNPDGAGCPYPMDRFADAWQNSDFHYVATSVAPSGTGPLQIDLSDALGFASIITASAMGLDMPTSIAAGEIVESLCDDADWDSILLTL
jgi:hypothetical protein